jgi:hypothetical protein
VTPNGAPAARGISSAPVATGARGNTGPAQTTPHTMTVVQARDFNDRYMALSTRASRARTGLARMQNLATRAQATGRIPGGITADVRDARGRMDTQLQAAINAINLRDAAKAEEGLENAEEALGVVEKFLGQ